MPSGPFAHVCMVVRDLDTAIEDWTKILRVLDPASLEDRIVKYDEFSSGDDAGMKWATFVNPTGTEIQFIQPAPARRWANGSTRWASTSTTSASRPTTCRARWRSSPPKACT
ncbi:hypothetical protein ACFSLT_31075 [Novosphingobium resinovorum]